MRVDLHRSAQLDNSLRRIATFAFEHTQQVVNQIIPRNQLLRSPQPLRRYLKVSLAQREQAPVCPACRFSLGQLCRPLEGAVSAHIVSHLQSSKAYVKSPDFVQICLARRLGQPGGVASTEQQQENGRQRHTLQPAPLPPPLTVCTPHMALYRQAHPHASLRGLGTSSSAMGDWSRLTEAEWSVIA